MTDAKIVNMVAKTRFVDNLDINAVADDLEIEYEQEQFPGMVYRCKDPVITILLFRSGNAVATGATCAKDVDKAFKILWEELNDLEYTLWPWADVSKTIELQNIVVTHNHNRELNLNRLIWTLPFEKTEYEPEQFPGLILRLDTPKAACLVFSSGKCVITGCRSVDDTKQAVILLDEMLMEAQPHDIDYEE